MWVEKHRGKWRIRDRAGDRIVTVKSGLTSKTIAGQVMTTLAADKLRGDALVPRGGRLALGAWLDIWYPSYEASLKPASVRSRRTVIIMIRGMLGHLPLDDIDQTVVQQWVGDLLAGRTLAKRPRPLARKTVANAHGMLHTIFSEAVAQRLVRVNPCARTRLPAIVHREMRFLTEPEAGRLLAAVAEHYRPFVLALLGTGMRWSEAVALRVRDVDVLAKRIHVRRGLHRIGGQWVETEPKTRWSKRTIAVTEDLAAALIPLVAGRGSGDHVFVEPDGEAYRYNTFNQRWRKARLAAELDGVRVHDLRHTHAAWLISSHIRGGVATVSRRLGHSSVRITIDLYGHLMPEVDDDVITALDARLPRIHWDSAIADEAPLPKIDAGSTGGAPGGKVRGSEGEPGLPGAD